MGLQPDEGSRLGAYGDSSVNNKGICVLPKQHKQASPQLVLNGVVIALRVRQAA